MSITFVGVDVSLKRNLVDKAGMLLEDDGHGVCTMEFYDVLSMNYIPEEDAIVIIRKSDAFKIYRSMFLYAEFR